MYHAQGALMLDSLIPDEFRKRMFNQKFNQNNIRKKSKESKNVSFSNIVEEKAEENFSRDIDEFLIDLSKLEKNLMDHPNEETIESYRKAISGFFKNMSANYQILDFSRKKGKSQKILRVIDQELDNLYKEVFGNNLRGLMLLGKLQKIKGLIIDLKIGEEKK
jgi:uncharacterized protein YaaR (DUF327 family)